MSTPSMPGLTPARVEHVTRLGTIVLGTYGEEQCLAGYQTADPFWVGHNALGFGDIEEDGTLT